MHCAIFIIKWSNNTQFIIASPIGTALIPTHGSCRPLTDIDVFFPNLSIVFLEVRIDEVGLTANETFISCPEEIPPSIPPA